MFLSRLSHCLETIAFGVFFLLYFVVTYSRLPKYNYLALLVGYYFRNFFAQTLAVAKTREKIRKQHPTTAIQSYIMASVSNNYFLQLSALVSQALMHVPQRIHSGEFGFFCGSKHNRHELLHLLHDVQASFL